MAISSLTILTKYTSGTTIVTEDTANAWFGGLYGSYEAESLAADDPRVVGHQHDGQLYDGHSSKINLVNHVVGQLQNQHLGTDAVTKRTIASFLNQALAIPEYEIIDGDTYYNLNLTAIYAYVDDLISAQPFEAADTGSPTGLDTVRQVSSDYSATGLDFVFGSAKLDDLASGTAGDNRFLFDKSGGSFRAGGADADHWDSSNRGEFSAAFGKNNKVVAPAAFSAGLGNTVLVTSDESAVFGKNNVAASTTSLVFGEEALSSVPGEFVHASGYIAEKGDAQSSEFTVRGIMSMTPGVGATLSIDGAGANFMLDGNSAYNVSVLLTGKVAAPGIQAGAYKMEAIAMGPTAFPAAASVSVPILTYISRTAYFTAGAGPNVVPSLIIGAGNTLVVHVADASIVITETAWVANVKITKIKY